MTIILRHFILSLSTAYYLSNKEIKNFFNIFIIRFFFAFAYIRRLFYPTKYLFEDYKSHFFTENLNAVNVINSLTNFGYYSKFKLEKNILQEIKNEINFNNSFIYSKESTKNQLIQFTTNDQLDDIVKKSILKNLAHVALDIDIEKTKTIKNLINNSVLKQIARSYIGSRKILVTAQCYISNPMNVSEKIKKNNAQYFHYDLDFKKFLKVFIYLDDVCEKSGPHIFVSKTHKYKRFKHILAERLDDEEILKYYENNDLIKFIGDKGSVIIEDTFGLHKGEHPQNNSRKMLILIFGTPPGIEKYRYKKILD